MKLTRKFINGLLEKEDDWELVGKKVKHRVYDIYYCADICMGFNNDNIENLYDIGLFEFYLTTTRRRMQRLAEKLGYSEFANLEFRK